MVETQSLALGEQGLQEAHSRLDMRLAAEQDPLVPLGEMLAWAYAIEAWYGGDVPDSQYRSARESDEDGKVAAGFRYARNRLTHQLGLVTRVIVLHGDRFLASYNAPSTDDPVWHWVPAAQLRQLAGGRDEALFPYYRDHLAGRRLSEPLPAVVRWLTEGAKKALARDRQQDP